MRINVRRWGFVEVAFAALVIVTVVCRALGELPAPGSAVAAVQALAERNDGARREVAATLAADPSPSRLELRSLRARVDAIEATPERLSEDPATRAIDSERRRLEALPVSAMSPNELSHWVVFILARYMPMIVGAFVAGCALLLLRARRLVRPGRG